jgi:hypothetical protein
VDNSVERTTDTWHRCREMARPHSKAVITGQHRLDRWIQMDHTASGADDRDAIREQVHR